MRKKNVNFNFLPGDQRTGIVRASNKSNYFFFHRKIATDVIVSGNPKMTDVSPDLTFYGAFRANFDQLFFFKLKKKLIKENNKKLVYVNSRQVPPFLTVIKKDMFKISPVIHTHQLSNLCP